MYFYEITSFRMCLHHTLLKLNVIITIIMYLKNLTITGDSKIKLRVVLSQNNTYRYLGRYY